MEILKSLFKGLIHGGIGAIIGAAFATAFGWKVWLFTVLGYISGWLLLSKSFWEGIEEGKKELAEETRLEQERRNTKKGVDE